MRIVPLADNVVGSRLARNIVSSSGALLLAEGTILTSRYVKRLLAKGYRRVYIADELSRDIVVDEHVSPAAVRQAHTVMQQALYDVTTSRHLRQVADMNKAVELIIDELDDKTDVNVALSIVRSVDEYTLHHSVNVAILSLVLGKAVGYDRETLKVLGIGAMLHDIGKAFLPREWLTRAGTLTKFELDEVKRHPEYGFDLLRQHFEINLLSAHIAFQHHERLDGSGYPRGLSGEEIHEFAQICAVADVYDAMTADRSYRPAMLPDEALAEIQADAGTLFSPGLVDLLSRHVAAYPVGTLVLLSSNEIGLVTGQTNSSFRPRVRILTAPDGHLVPPFECDLSLKPDLAIDRVLMDYPDIVYEQLKQSPPQLPASL